MGVADAEEDVLRPFEGLLRIGGVLVTDGGDVSRGLYEPAHGGGAVDDAGEVLRVDGRGNGSDDVAEVAGAADLVKPLLERKLTGNADLVYGFAALVEGLTGLVAPPVTLAVEVVRFQESRNVCDRLAVDQERADYGFFSL